MEGGSASAPRNVECTIAIARERTGIWFRGRKVVVSGLYHDDLGAYAICKHFAADASPERRGARNSS